MTDEPTPAQDLRSALEPCPFCGGPARKIDFGSRVGIKCADGNCGGTTRLALPGEDYASMWNARAALAQPAENAKAGEVVADQLSQTLADRNEERFKVMAFVHRHAIIAALAQPPAAEPVKTSIPVWGVREVEDCGHRGMKGYEVLLPDGTWTDVAAHDPADAIATANLDWRARKRPAAEPVGLRKAISLALQCTPHVSSGDDGFDDPHIVYDCGDPWEILRAALTTTARTDDAGRPSGDVEPGHV